MAIAAQGSAGAQGKQAGQNLVPFLLGSNIYTEPPFASYTVTLDGSQHSILPVPQVTPGNFLDGLTLRVSSTGGALGGGTITADGALAVLNSLSFVNTNGGEILYPMGLFEYVMAHKYLTPWKGDPQKYPDYSNTINPAVTVDLSVGVKETLAILSNTDARAQYRLNGTVAPLADLVTGGTPTAPAVTVEAWVNMWRQPPATDYAGRAINPFPPGLGVQRKVMSQTINMPASGTATLRLTLTGNEIRGLILIARDSSGARVDLTDANAGSIFFRMDNGTVWRQNPSQLVQRMEYFYSQYFGAGLVNRETGVYAIPRFRSPNGGDAWLPTVEQTYLDLELGSADIPSGTVEVIYDQLAVGVQLPASLESV